MSFVHAQCKYESNSSHFPTVCHPIYYAMENTFLTLNAHWMYVNKIFWNFKLEKHNYYQLPRSTNPNFSPSSLPSDSPEFNYRYLYGCSSKTQHFRVLDSFSLRPSCCPCTSNLQIFQDNFCVCKLFRAMFSKTWVDLPVRFRFSRWLCKCQPAPDVVPISILCAPQAKIFQLNERKKKHEKSLTFRRRQRRKLFPSQSVEKSPSAPHTEGV